MQVQGGATRIMHEVQRGWGVAWRTRRTKDVMRKNNSRFRRKQGGNPSNGEASGAVCWKDSRGR